MNKRELLLINKLKHIKFSKTMAFKIEDGWVDG